MNIFPTRINKKILSRCLTLILLIVISLSLLSLTSDGYSSYINNLQDCWNCHVSGDVTSLNPFGLDFEAVATHASDSDGAIASITDTDSDGDGFTNGEEMVNGTNPGDDTSFPSSIVVPKFPELEIINFTKSSEDPIVGDKLLIYGKIVNIGEGDAYDVTVSLFDEDELVDQYLSNLTILSSETRFFIFGFYPEADNHKFEIVVEYSEGNISDYLYVHVDTESESISSPGILLVFTVIGLVAICSRLMNRKKIDDGGK